MEDVHAERARDQLIGRPVDAAAEDRRAEPDVLALARQELLPLDLRDVEVLLRVVVRRLVAQILDRLVDRAEEDRGLDRAPGHRLERAVAAEGDNAVGDV